jgi:hypothetical protein
MRARCRYRQTLRARSTGAENGLPEWPATPQDLTMSITLSAAAATVPNRSADAPSVRVQQRPNRVWELIPIQP